MDEKTQAELIVKWLRQQVENAGAKGVVLGLSGGIDSSLTAVLCKIAFPKNCLALALPCNSHKLDLAHAKVVAKKFEFELKEINLDKSFKSILSALGAKGNEKAREVANIKPRLRMVALYYFANKLDCLVVGTSNKSELAIGYFTKFGDSATDLLPLGNLYKGDIKKLAAYLGLPKEILEKPPSAGLWKGQTDEAELGISYEQIDTALALIEMGQEDKADPVLVERVKVLMQRATHKRSPALVCKLEG
ncbi:MAG: NAD(+) synthase [Candidatus Diapherotrites archaeon]|uniref:NH(3)-dependent NAD(+) synthetase n=1 Tax=Candidatus Iainarchaeum sp. TaxID=3101447 RepID=A0A939C9C7_9ARCH|nr:NAD(+) synthase [Candidatus Diapherotrites archaeon]